MTIVREEKVCPKCKRKYLFNPDVRKGLFCPHCLGVGKVKKNTNELPMKEEKNE